MTGAIVLSIMLCSGPGVDSCRELTGNQSFPTVQACVARGRQLMAHMVEQYPGLHIDSLICGPAEGDEE